MQVVTHKPLRGCMNPFNLRLESCFHDLARLNTCNDSQVERGSSTEYTLLFSAASTKERKTSRKPGVSCGMILCVSVRHAAMEEVLEVEVRLVSGTLCRSPKTDYALSRSNLQYNVIRNPADCRLDIGTTFSAGSRAGFLGTRVLIENSEGPSNAAGREINRDSGNDGTQPPSVFIFPAYENQPRTSKAHFSFDSILQPTLRSHWITRRWCGSV